LHEGAKVTILAPARMYAVAPSMPRPARSTARATLASVFVVFVPLAALVFAALVAVPGCRKAAGDDETPDATPPASSPSFDAGALVDAPSDVGRDTRAEDERAAWADAGHFCGDGKLQPDCPMQAWMKKNAATMLGFGDISSIADVFDRIAKMAPDDVGPDGRLLYANWRSISDDGAAAARAGDVPAAKAACRGCHVQYLKWYQGQLRGRPVPGAP
jgi:hypothetical protein